MYFIVMIYIFIVSCLVTIVQNLGQPITIKMGYLKKSVTVNILLTIILMFPLVMLATLRSTVVGSDTADVYEGIYYMGYAVYEWPVTIYEGLFIQFVKIVHALVPEFRAFLMASSIIISGIFTYRFVAVRKQMSLPIAMLGFFIFLFCPFLNGLRQLLAVSVCFYGLYKLENEKPGVTALIYIVASFIHITALIMFITFIPYYAKEHKRARNKVLILFCAGPIIIELLLKFFMRIPFLDKFAEQIGAFSVSSVNIKFLLFPLLVLPLIALYAKKLLQLNTFNFIHLCSYITVFSSIFLSGHLWFAFRLMYYFLPGLIILLAQIAYDKSKKINFITYNCYIIFSMLITFWIVYIVRETDGIYPYVFL